MAKRRSTRRPIVFGQHLPPQDLARVQKLQAAKRQAVMEHPLRWPQWTTLTPDQCYSDPTRGGLMRHPSLVAIDNAILAAKGGKGKGGGGGGKPKWPDRNMVRAEVKKAQGNKPVAGNSGNIVYSSLNGEFADGSKIKFFADTYVLITEPVHVMHLQEWSKSGGTELAKLTGYHVIISDENSRGQAVGLAFHPRCEMIGKPIQYDDFKNVQNGQIPDLRPALRQDWHDSELAKKEGKQKRIVSVSVHPKSMLGGPKTTGAIRYLQFESLMNNLASESQQIDNKDPNAPWGIVIAGDFNFVAWKNFPEVKPLLKNGFRMVALKDRRTTNSYSDDSRIDYIYVKGFEGVNFDHYDLLQFFKIKKIGRAFTDHARIESQLCDMSADNTSPSDYKTDATASGGSGDKSGDSKSGNGDKSGDSKSDNGDDKAQMPTGGSDLPAIMLRIRPQRSVGRDRR